MWLHTRSFRFFVLVAVLASPSTVLQAADEKLDGETAATIEHLIEYVGESNLTFVRNWEEHGSEEAVEHIRKKYDFFADKGMIRSVEDFILWTATRSYLTGQLYKVRMGNGETTPVHQWLKDELERYRQAQEATGAETAQKPAD